MELIIIVLILIIIMGIIYINNYKNNSQTNIDKITKILESETKEKERYKREINRLEYDREIKNCEVENMIISKKITHKVKGNKKIKILVGDYYMPSVRNTCGVLLKMGFDVDVVKRADDIIELIKENMHYDLIITNNEYDEHSNYKMGSDVLNDLKELDDFSIPIIILTVSNERNKFLSQGFSEHIQKILDEKKVMDTFPKVIKNIKFEAIKKQ